MDTTAPTPAQQRLHERVVVHATNSSFDLPVNTDGSPYQLCWLDRDITVFANTYSDLIAVLLPEYLEPLEAESDRDLLQLRLNTLAKFAMIEQERVCTIAAETLEEDDPDSTGLPELVVQIAFTPKDGDIIELDEWPLDNLPLYLLTTQYAPYTDVVAPTGAGVRMLSPVTERTFLEALVTLGLGTLFSNPIA